MGTQGLTANNHKTRKKGMNYLMLFMQPGELIILSPDKTIMVLSLVRKGFLAGGYYSHYIIKTRN
jgi:hypothetical protein